MIRHPLLVLVFTVLVVRADSQTTSPPDTSRSLKPVASEVSFPDGEAKWQKLLEKNVNPNVAAENGAPNGRYLIVVQFVLNKQGQISDVRALTNEGYGMEAEVVRHLKKGSSWTPASTNEKPSNTYHKQSVTFTVSQDGFYIRSKTPYTLFTDTDNELVLEIGQGKTEKLNAAISDGVITKKGDCVFTARVNKPGRVLVTVFKKNKKRKPIGEMSFEVKRSEQSGAQ